MGKFENANDQEFGVETIANNKIDSKKDIFEQVINSHEEIENKAEKEGIFKKIKGAGLNGEIGSLDDLRKLAAEGTTMIGGYGCNSDFRFPLNLEKEDIFLAYLQKKRLSQDLLSHGSGSGFLFFIMNLFSSLISGKSHLPVKPEKIMPDKFFSVALSDANLEKFKRNGKIKIEKSGHVIELTSDLKAQQSTFDGKIQCQYITIDGKTFGYQMLRKEFEEKYGEDESVRVVSSLCDFVTNIFTDEERNSYQREYLTNAHGEAVKSLKQDILNQPVNFCSQNTDIISTDVSKEFTKKQTVPQSIELSQDLTAGISKTEQATILNDFKQANLSQSAQNTYKPESLFQYEKSQENTEESQLKH